MVKPKLITFPICFIFQAKTGWYNNFNYPSAIAAIDCTHVRITKPSANHFGDDYINRKGYPSVNIQMTCNSNCVITSYDATNPGSVHDQRIFKNSPLYEFMLNSRGSTLIGDEGYALTPFLMIPFKEPSNEIEQNFNKVHCKARIKIEHVFGQLKSRFPVLHYGIRLPIHKVSKVISASIILHNIAKHLGDLDNFDEIAIMPLMNVNIDNNLNLLLKGKARRLQISQAMPMIM